MVHIKLLAQSKCQEGEKGRTDEEEGREGNAFLCVGPVIGWMKFTKAPNKTFISHRTGFESRNR